MGELVLKRCRLVAAMLASALLLAMPADACGPNSDCKIGERHYRIRMPSGHDGKTPIGAIVFAHGYTGNERQAMENQEFTEVARQLNVALIATKSSGKGWTLPGSPTHNKVQGADELAYFDHVIEDAGKRFPIDRKRLVAAGFSAGGMMVWNLACHRSGMFAGFVAISGTFWRPVPRSCEMPIASVVHIHGDVDKVVPIKGRPIADTYQGDVNTALDMYIKFGAFGQPRPVRLSGLKCQVHKNADGNILDFCLFSGGHYFLPRHVRQGWDMLVSAGRL